MNKREFLKTIMVGGVATPCSPLLTTGQAHELHEITKLRQVRFRELISSLESRGVSRWRIFHAISDYVLSAESPEHCFIVTPIHAELIFVASPVITVSEFSAVNVATCEHVFKRSTMYCLLPSFKLTERSPRNKNRHLARRSPI